ncbi:Endonuclease/exonuclease/phosphatase [Desulfotomaculum nigrificans CO-1-SRB]|uniref:Endonuclease/exonuclease/phosphatase n=1 Tax=Desulfotomaculum nigrificans (strain DSM 14880 / VKM B-2319 / CO-1-SRB) TaxID=868595 RepID=F6B7Q1_DESCC|nr:Endonuclease/exonuclease/phosphatase [Desulfotomaculum nigrificans CO-1-SRB]
MQTIKVVSYNIRYARGMDDQVNLNRVAAVLAWSGAQLMGLQEVDKHLPRSGFRHQAKHLGWLLHRHWVFAPNVKWGPWAQYGNAVLSYWPIIEHKHYPLPSKGEPRGLLEVEVNINNRAVAFFCTHLGLSREERLEQVEIILKVMTAANKPSILVGDFNDDRDSQEFNLISRLLQDATAITGGFETFPADNEQLDFVFVSHHWQVLAARPIISRASDHLPVLVELSLNN